MKPARSEERFPVGVTGVLGRGGVTGGGGVDGGALVAVPEAVEGLSSLTSPATYMSM